MKNQNLSGQYAALLLTAWDSADSGQIRSAAEKTEGTPAVTIQPDCGPDATIEQERLEMVREAGELLRLRTFGAGSAEDVAAALRLLNHIADTVKEGPQRARHASGRR